MPTDFLAPFSLSVIDSDTYYFLNLKQVSFMSLTNLQQQVLLQVDQSIMQSLIVIVLLLLLLLTATTHLSYIIFIGLHR